MIEHVSDLIGSWGPLQKRLFLLLGVIYCASPYNNASLFYYALKSDLICVQSDGSQVINYESIMNNFVLDWSIVFVIISQLDYNCCW